MKHADVYAQIAETDLDTAAKKTNKDDRDYHLKRAHVNAMLCVAASTQIVPQIEPS